MALLIGIDPGVNTGVALWDAKAKALKYVDTMRIDEALHFVWCQHVEHDVLTHEVKVIVEDARQRRWIPRESSVSELKGRAMGAGSVKRDCQIWQDFLNAHGIKYEMVPPHQGATKWTTDTFARITGYKGRTSNHGRDAAVLVFGR